MKRITKLVSYLFFCMSFSFAFGDDKDVVQPVVTDGLQRVVLNGQELGGELNRRICDLIYKNYMVVDFDAHWLDHFRNREDRAGRGGVYYGIGKVIDAGSLFTAYTNDPKVDARTRYLIDELMKTRDADGYLGFWNVEPDNQQNHINWILHEQEYINLALTRHYRMTGDKQSLENAKVMADYIMKSFPINEEGIYNIPAGISIAGIAEGFVEIYRLTGEEKYWDYACNLQYEPHWFYEPYDEWAANIPNRGFHLYVMLSHMYPETERYRLCGDENLLKKSLWMKQQLLEEDHGALLITGSSSQGEHFTYNQDGAGMVEESCVTAYLLRLFDSLMRIEGDLRYGDILERTIYNALFAAQEPNGRRICYFTPFTGKRQFQEGDTFCCNGNFRRAVAEIPNKVWFRTPDEGIALNLYTDSQKSFEVKGSTVEIQETTNYPNDGEVKLSFKVSKPVKFAFRFRTPRWAETMTVCVNNEKAIDINPAESELGGYVLDRVWKTGDTVQISMPMSWRLVIGRATQYGRVALMRGPVLFGIGEAQNPELLSKVAQYRDLVIDPSSIGEPVLDDSIRPDGQKVAAKAWTNQEKSGDQVDVVFTEFTDPTDLDVYFYIPDMNDAAPIRLMKDELFTEPRTSAYEELVAALYGPKAKGPIEKEFEVQGNKLADLAADYVSPAGKTDQTAVFDDSTKTGSWSYWLLKDKRQPTSAEGNLVPLSSGANVYGTPLGYAFGCGDPSGLGFLANHDPSPNQDANWKMYFTENTFDKVIPADQLNRFLLTHPIADSNSAILVRWTPNQQSFKKGLALAGTIMARGSLDGILYEMSICEKDGTVRSISAFSTKGGQAANGVGSIEFIEYISVDSFQYIDFLVSNNGDLSADSTAMKIEIFEPTQKIEQENVTQKMKAIYKNQLKTDFGPFEKGKTLKLKLRKQDTGMIHFVELADGEILEL